ncbi:putative holin-like toxin [Staphylococcus delphini]|uniref:putative holin-like toxin n=1 Tax=Staphylococcus delphini TaxID=53344 RepID=UPI0037DA390D
MINMIDVLMLIFVFGNFIVALISLVVFIAINVKKITIPNFGRVKWLFFIFNKATVFLTGSLRQCIWCALPFIFIN